MLKQARRLLGLWLVALGGTLILLGDGRIQGPAYASVREGAQTLHASPSILWGSLAIACGALTLWSRTKVVGLFTGTVWMTAYCIGFWLAVGNPLTSPTAAVTYTFIVILYTAVFALEKQ